MNLYIDTEKRINNSLNRIATIADRLAAEPNMRDAVGEIHNVLRLLAQEVAELKKVQRDS